VSPNQAVLHRHSVEQAGQPAFPSDPLAMALGARLMHVETQQGSVRLQFEPGKIFLQGEGVIQGGAVCAMLDFATACAAMAVLPAGRDCATITLTSSFFRPIRHGRFLVDAQIEKQGRTAVFARASIAAAEEPERVLATASAVLAVVAPRQRTPATAP
jgi:uncharacterized protein (TIGR00369 family)